MAAASRRTSPTTTPRRVTAIKRADGEPLTRLDIQYDLLNEIFSNEEKAFTNPFAASNGPPSTEQGGSTPPTPSTTPGRTTFKQLYIDAILHSPKATKALKDKMKESPAFALDFAMLSLLVNVGRVNTTMSFFPEMKTVIRSYHPVPSLQRTNGNMQDAPRIKHILKMSLLDEETKDIPATPAEIMRRCKAGQPPSTSVTNLLFVLAHHTGPVGARWFQGTFDFLDIFLRTDVSSASRARVFLWFCCHYLEAPEVEDDYDGEYMVNPFGNPGPPGLVYLTPEEANAENQETEEDKAITEKLLSQRNKIVATQSAKGNAKSAAAVGGKGSTNGSVKGEGGDDDELASLEETPKSSKAAPTKRAAPGTGLTAKERRQAAKERKAAIAAATAAPVASPVSNATPKQSHRERPSYMSHLPDLDDDESDNDFAMYSGSLPTSTILEAVLTHQRRSAKPYFPGLDQPSTPTNGSLNHHRRRLGTPDVTNGSSHSRRFSPYATVASLRKESSSTATSSSRRSSRHISQPRTMLEQAWHVISSTDPLLDSDDEGADEYVREDYVQRLRVLDRLAPSNPSSSSQDQSPQSADMDVDL